MPDSANPAASIPAGGIVPRERSPAAKLSVLVLLVSLLTIAGRQLVEAIPVQAALAFAPNPYLIPSHAIELYVLVPLASLAGCAFLLSPGLLVALATSRRGGDFGVWVLKGFAIGLPLVTTWAALVQACLGGALLQSSGFFWSIAALNAACLALVWRRHRRNGIDWTIFEGRAPDIAAMVLLPLAVLLLLSPKFYWENFNGDGAHALQAARLLIHRVAPIWPAGSIPMDSYPGLQSVTPSLPITWLIRLYGESEYAVRLSYMMGLPVAAATLLALIRVDGRQTGIWAPVSVALVLLCYSFCLAFNTTYDPYFADIALPLSREPIILVTFLGFALAYLRREYGWMFAFALLTTMTAPGGLILMGSWIAGAWLAFSPKPWGRSFSAGVAVVAAAVACALGTVLMEKAGLGVRGEEFGASGIAARLRYITIDDWQRWLWWILPAGIVPFAALFWWRRQDQVARAFTVMSFVYFLFFYVQAYRILPHHFTPVMLTPLIVFGRLEPVRDHPRAAALVAALGALIACVLSAPAVWRPHMEGSRLGSTIRVEGSNYAAFDHAEMSAVHKLLGQAFPMRWEEDAAEKHYIGGPLSWYYYAEQPNAQKTAPVYSIIKSGMPAPVGAQQIATGNGWTLFVLDPARYRQDVDHENIPRTMNALYYVPRQTIFGAGARDDYRHVWSKQSIKSWLGGLFRK